MQTSPAKFFIRNASTRLADADLVLIVKGIEEQLLGQFCTDWSINRIHAAIVPKENMNAFTIRTSPKDLLLTIYDLSVDALDNESIAIPNANVFVSPILNNGGSVLLGDNDSIPTLAQLISHEMFELIIDSFYSMWWFNGSTMYAADVCDPVQGNVVKINVKNIQIGYSDWVTPAWTHKKSTNTNDIVSYNHLNTLTEPFTMSPSGCIMTISGGVISYYFGDKVIGWIKEITNGTERLLRRRMISGQKSIIQETQQ